MSASKIQEYLDEHKRELSDEFYRKMCDLTMEQHKEEESTDTGLVEITYDIPCLWYGDDGQPNFSTNVKKKIVRLLKGRYEMINREIEDRGYARVNIYEDDEETVEVVSPYVRIHGDEGEEIHYGIFSITFRPTIISIKKL